MQRLKTFVTKQYITTQNKVASVHGCMLQSKKNGDKELIVSLVLIAVAVSLCVVYKASVLTILNSAITTLSSKIAELFK